MMADSRNPEDCVHFPLCEHLQEKVADVPAGLMMEALHMESELLCSKCPYFQPKEEN